MIQLKIHKFDLPLQHTFRIARGAHDVQPTLVVELSDGQHQGFGEATTNTYYNATYESMTAALESVQTDLANATLEDPAALYDQLNPQLKDNPFAQCALDQAAYDLWGKRQGTPVYQLWGLETTNNPVSNFTIGIDSDRNDGRQSCKQLPDWPIYKIKLGTAHDIEIVRQLRQHTARHVSRRCQLWLVGRRDNSQRGSAAGAGRRVHRTTAPAPTLGMTRDRFSRNRHCPSLPTKAASWKRTSTAVTAIFTGSTSN